MRAILIHGTRVALPAAALLAALAAWLSQGVVATATSDGPRIAVLPTSPAALAVAATTGAFVILLARAGASLAPIWLLGFLVLPWLPLPVPTAFLVWSGPLRWLVWTGVTIGLVLTMLRRQHVPATLTALVRERPRLCAGVLSFLVFTGGAWQVSPSVPGGDEPHYLVITQSLMLDGDLKIENNHRRGDYQAYFSGRLVPHSLRRGRDGEIYSIHAPGLSVLVLPAFAIGGYVGVVLFLLALAASGSALTWPVAWLATRPALVRIQPGTRLGALGGGGRGDQPLLALQSVPTPAGRYRIRPRMRGPGGWLMIGIGRDQFALSTEQLAFPPVPIEVDFPVDVAAFIVRGDEEARRTVRDLVVEPVSLLPAAARLTNAVARRAVRYATAAVFFLDADGLPEPEGFWVGGGRRASVVIQSDRPTGAIDMQLRNAPVENRITVACGGWREELTLAPGEERQLRIPLMPGRPVALVAFTTTSGFRPSAVDPASRDDRFLGLWVKVQ